MYRKAKSVSRWGRVGMLLHVLIINPNYTRIYHNIRAGSAIWSYFMWLGFLFILNRLFVCLFVHSFIFGLFFFKRVTIQIWDQTCQKLLPAVEVTSKHGWRDNKPINSCHKLCLLLFIVVLSFWIMDFCIYWIFVFIIFEFMYLLFLNLWIYYFKFMYLIYLNCVYYFWTHVFIQFMYL